MRKLIIDKREGYNYFLTDIDNNDKYNLNIEFYDLDFEVDVNDYIYIDEINLNEKILSFGSLKNTYGEDVTEDDNRDEIIIVVHNDNLYYLKQFYG